MGSSKGLPVTSVTASQDGGALDVVFLHELPPLFNLIGRGGPSHVVDLITGSDETLRVAMAVEAPLHLQRRNLPCHRHEINPPMAGGTSYAFVDVNAVIEIGEVRQVMNPRP